MRQNRPCLEFNGNQIRLITFGRLSLFLSHIPVLFIFYWTPAILECKIKKSILNYLNIFGNNPNGFLER